MQNSAAKRSPIKAAPLPVAGESSDRRALDIALDEGAPWLMAALMATLIAVLEWLDWLLDLPPAPKTMTLVAIVVIGIAAGSVRRAMAQARNYRLGRDGERNVAEILDGLVASGWRVFHDVPGPGFNVDHVAIGPGGILAIETKTVSKTASGKEEIHVVDNGIVIGHGRPDSSAIDQAKAQAQWLRTVLEKSTARTFAVRSVLCYPGWFIKDKRRAKDLWVLNPKALAKWLDRERPVLDAEDVALASSHLELYVRAVVAGQRSA